MVLVLACLVSATALAQRMPQDNWRYDGLQFASPAGSTLGSIAIGSGGVYVAELESSGDAPTNIIQFTEAGVFVRRFAMTLGSVGGIDCDQAGNVHVLDRTASVVKVFSPTGSFLRQFGSAGAGDGQFDLQGFNPALKMLAVDINGDVYVCDPGNSRVVVFSADGTFLRSWGERGDLPSQFARPQGNAWVSEPSCIGISPRGLIYVGGHAGRAVRVFDSSGAYRELVSIGTGLPGGGSAEIKAVSQDGLLVMDVRSPYYHSFGLIDPAGYRGLQDPGLSIAEAAAVSKRGDVFAITGLNTPWDRKRIFVFEREYSNVQNSRLPPAIPQPMVLAAGQRTGTSWMDIDYQVTDADSPTVTTGVMVFTNGGHTLTDAVVMNTFEEGTGGNVGANQPTGVTRHLTWNMAADWTIDFAQVQVEALARDSRNLLGFHWITIPASGGDPAIQVSAGPVADDKLLDVWFWLLATHQPGIQLSSGTISGTLAPYNGQSLASGASTTAAGRSYLYGLMNVRAITAAEITRAQGGNYGFSSVTANSVVRLP
jgi:hypothetical protein